MRTQLSKLSVAVGIILVAITIAIIYPQPAEGQAQVIKQKFDYPLDIIFLTSVVPVPNRRCPRVWHAWSAYRHRCRCERRISCKDSCARASYSRRINHP